MKMDLADEVLKYVNTEMYELFLGAAQRFQYRMKPPGVAACAAYAVGSYSGYAHLLRDEAITMFEIGYDSAIKDMKERG
jgi:hypothetical protein